MMLMLIIVIIFAVGVGWYYVVDEEKADVVILRKKLNHRLLELSIIKWDRIVYQLAIDQGMADCPLCQEYIASGSCDGCPIATDTGQHNCLGTPYTAWSNRSDDQPLATDRKTRQLAVDERDYLQSLLDRLKRLQ